MTGTRQGAPIPHAPHALAATANCSPSASLPPPPLPQPLPLPQLPLLPQLLVLPRMLRTDTREFKSAAGAIMGADVIVALGGMSNLNVRDVSIKARGKGTRLASCNVRSQGDWAIVGVLDVDPLGT